jgi:hypothetical protein
MCWLIFAYLRNVSSSNQPQNRLQPERYLHMTLLSKVETALLVRDAQPRHLIVIRRLGLAPASRELEAEFGLPPTTSPSGCKIAVARRWAGQPRQPDSAVSL